MPECAVYENEGPDPEIIVAKKCRRDAEHMMQIGDGIFAICTYHQAEIWELRRHPSLASNVLAVNPNAPGG